ncbi:unknown [Spodoptera litura nucleopolyhedrovirus]|uniref:Nudix hydrolase domain-containing protein n=1 Tax=Spodoptera litura multicapsid nucleopolyhedrovirus TaxID=46242 RepID=Q9IK81_NPVST|nr:hypothetical protein [Spodoptera litura nucleopolyhedrovirus]WML75104.1 hypothetical protein KBIHDJOI_00061 [Spodoptera littoralis nucleopolyhedrovirus]AAF72584.1 unknown [Spodoptera litura nucleopolyhedrovirus]AAL01721.1 unknown [Spodoptera litura nucleopolyhedrovirus]QHN73885.1 hypothetical protein [Spodoptera litura nucleopolyhedrovirus]UQV25568.1 hypothetical protein [Spodoptera litura nucleopolyhedrovirus]
MRCSGLLLINDDDEAILLHASKSYAPRRIYNGGYDETVDEQEDEEDNFLEKISIPRGKWDSRDIFDYETAIREFIEETGTVFDGAYVYRRPFFLRWTDKSVNYTYMIYVALLRGNLRPLTRKPNTFCVKLLRRKHNRYLVELEDRRYANKEISRALCIVPTDHYFRYMRERQLTKYEASNYLDFFGFVETVKADYDKNPDDDRFFFFIQLQWKKRTTIVA